MTRIIIALCCAVGLFACESGVPEGVIAPEKMESILYDIHLVDGFVAVIPSPDSAKKVAAPYYKGVFKKYGIDSATQAKSMAYYYKNPDVLLKMYENIDKRVIKAKDDLQKLRDKEAKAAADKARLRAKKLATVKSLDSVNQPKPALKQIK